MAKVKRVSTLPSNYLVKIEVKDEHCTFSINPYITFMKLVKAANMNAAVKAAATYCNKQMKEYPGTWFSYSTSEVEPYFYPLPYRRFED